jgi:hypothetical protein
VLDRRTRRRTLGFGAMTLVATLVVSGCGGGLSREEDDWCGTHLDDVKRVIPDDQLGEYGYMDDIWKDACRRAFAQR